MKIVSCNLNGIRSAHRKGFFDWYKKQKSDVLCIQELKAQEEQIDIKSMFSKGIYSYFKCAEKKGYSGVSIHTREKPDKVIYQYGDKEFDNEGRYIEAQFGDLSIVSLYAPSGSSGEIRQEAKFRFLESFKKHLLKILKSNRKFIICGDWNIAHKEIDLKNWKNNKKNSGFLPEERSWISEVVFGTGWVDVFRKLEPNKEQYTWWSQRGRARENNVGWRIDYQISTPKIASRAVSAWVEMNRKFSDHAPLVIDYD